MTTEKILHGSHRVAQMLGCTGQTIRNLCNAGKLITAAVTSHGHRLIAHDEVERFRKAAAASKRRGQPRRGRPTLGER